MLVFEFVLFGIALNNCVRVNINIAMNLLPENFWVIYEVCPKSNKTGVIKTSLKNIEIYQCQIPSKYYPSLCICLFHDSKHSWKAFSGIFLSSVIAAILMELMSEKWVPFRTDLILGKRKKSHGARLGEYGGVPKLQCFFLQETDKYLGAV